MYIYLYHLHILHVYIYHLHIYFIIFYGHILLHMGAETWIEEVIMLSEIS